MEVPMARHVRPFIVSALLFLALLTRPMVGGVIDDAEVGETGRAESIDSLKGSDGEIRADPPTVFLFAPRIASVQVDLLKLIASFDLYGNATLDLFRFGRTRFGMQAAAYNHGDFCFAGVGGNTSCDEQGIAGHLDLLAHVSWHFPGNVETDARVRLSAMAGAGYVEGYRKREGQAGWNQLHDERVVPKLGAAVQLRLVDWLTLSLDYTVAIGWPETTAEYIPLGLRIGYTGW
jgi:hypothetical protein